jgi:DNA-binding XRE family transcriptional regulator
MSIWKDKAMKKMLYVTVSGRIGADEFNRHLGKESGVDYRKKPRKTNSSRIAAARIEKGWTQAQLAEAIGVDQQHIARWENGVRNPKIEALLKIAEALGVDVKTLIQQ